MKHAQSQPAHVPGRQYNIQQPVVQIEQTPIVLRQVPVGPHPAKKNRKTFLYLGIIQLTLGAISIILCVVSIANTQKYYNNTYSGFWNGVWLIAAGSLGIATWKRPGSCTVIAGMIITILCAISCFSAGIYESILASLYCSYNGHYISRSNCVESRAVHGILGILAFAGMIVNILHSGLCCSASCCPQRQQQPVPLSATTYITTTSHPTAYQQNMNPNRQIVLASPSIPNHAAVAQPLYNGGMAPKNSPPHDNQLPPNNDQ